MKKSADSLLFEMEDIDSNLKGSVKSSMDKLNLSTGSEDVFDKNQPTEREETSMSISPDNYLDDHRSDMEKSLSSLDSGHSGSPQKASADPEYQIQSGAEVERKKSGKEVTRKKSVRELLSKFESSTQSESSDDASKAATLKEEPESITAESSRQSQDASSIPEDADRSPVTSIIIRKPSSGISDRIKSYQTFHAASSDESDQSVPLSDGSRELHIEENSKPMDRLDPADQRLSDDPEDSSPRINDLLRRFQGQSDVQKGSEPENTDKRDSSDSKGDPRKSHGDRTSSTFVKPRPSLPFNQSEKDVEQDPASRQSRGSLSERLQNLSDRFRNYDEDTDVEARSEHDSQGSLQRKSEKHSSLPASAAASSKGQFTTRFSHPEKPDAPSVAGGASGSGSESELSNCGQEAASGEDSQPTSLFERRKKFESFGPADKPGSEPSSASVATSKHHASGSHSDRDSKDIMTKARQFGSRSVVLQTSRESLNKIAGASQDDALEMSKADAKTQSLPRDVTPSETNPKPPRRARNQNGDERPVSVRDLSKQFERQLSEKSDSSRASSGSLKTGWSCAHDVANANAPISSAGDDQESLRNKNSQQQSVASIL